MQVNRNRPGRVLEPDLCVIGGGTAGHAAALAAAALGVHCIVVDEREPLGAGQAADLAEAMIIAAAHAQTQCQAPFDWVALRDRVATAVDALAPNVSAERLRSVGATLIRSTARFVDPDTVMTDDAAIRARRFVVATGSRPATAPMDIDHFPSLALSDLRRLAGLPSALAILADDGSGFEWAQALRRLGAAVTLIHRQEEAVTDWDSELIDVLLTRLRREGVTIHSARKEDRLTAGDQGLALVQANGPPLRIAASALLRLDAPIPAIDGLGLDQAGVRCVGGAPAVGGDLRTSNRRIYAVGDVLGRPSPGGAAIPVQVGLVLRAALFRQPVHFRAGHVPVHLRTDPAIAQVGALTDRAASTARPSRLHRWPFGESGRAAATGDHTGHVKVRATAGGTVIGVGIVGRNAEELIVPWTLAITHDIRMGAMAALPVPALSASDVSRRAATTFVTSRLRSPWVKRVLGLIRRLG